MRFTLDLSHHSWTRDPTEAAPRRTLDLARAADAGGIDAIWVSEDPEGWDAFTVLGAIAAVTASAHLGTSVTSPYPRHPNLLAASVATLDRLCGGRAALGLGRGQTEWHRDALGVDTGEPMQAIEETIGLLQEWWAAPHRASSPRDGHFAVRDWERVVHPARESVPILLAAVGPQTLDLAGAIADGVILNALASTAFLAEAIPRARAAARAAGHDAAALLFPLRTTVTVTTDADPDVERRARDRDKTLFALIATLPGMDRLVQSADYDVAAIVENVREIMQTEDVLAEGGGFPELRRQGDLTAARDAIPDGLIRQLGIVGPLPVVHERLRDLEALGVTHVGVAPPAEATSADAWRSLLASLRDGLQET